MYVVMVNLEYIYRIYTVLVRSSQSFFSIIHLNNDLWEKVAIK